MKLLDLSYDHPSRRIIGVAYLYAGLVPPGKRSVHLLSDAEQVLFPAQKNLAPADGR